MLQNWSKRNKVSESKRDNPLQDYITQRAPALAYVATIGWRWYSPPSLGVNCHVLLQCGSGTHRRLSHTQTRRLSQNTTTMAAHVSMCRRVFDFNTLTHVRKVSQCVSGNAQRLYSSATQKENELELGESTLSAGNFTASLKTGSREVIHAAHKSHLQRRFCLIAHVS